MHKCVQKVVAVIPAMPSRMDFRLQCICISVTPVFNYFEENKNYSSPPLNITLMPVLLVLQENEKSRDILIEQRFHKSMIGAAGGKIKEIRDKFNQVQHLFSSLMLV